MTVAIATTITAEQAVIAELETEFDTFRSRIARLSIEASGTLTDMFNPLGPVEDEVIDITAVTAIEWAQYELEVAPAIDVDAVVLEFAAA